jgi:Fe-S-cluster containining protein
MKISETFYAQIVKIFEQMDRAYDAAAKTSGFICNGCKDNCCKTRFYHHTLLEFLYLKSGLASLEPGILEKVRGRARAVLEKMDELEAAGKPIRVMCPLNKAGRCILYIHRPMICRLHGIPHALRRPDGQLQTGPACDDFHAQCGETTENHLDRTPLYIAMAKLEQRLRKELGYKEKIKMTIAEIIDDDSVKF